MQIAPNISGRATSYYRTVQVVSGVDNVRKKYVEWWTKISNKLSNWEPNNFHQSLQIFIDSDKQSRHKQMPSIYQTF